MDNVAGSKQYSPSPIDSRRLFWLDGTAVHSKEGWGFFKEKKKSAITHWKTLTAKSFLLYNGNI